MDWIVKAVSTENGDLIVELSTKEVEVSPGFKLGNSATVKIPREVLSQIADLLASCQERITTGKDLT